MENTGDARQTGLLVPFEGRRPESPGWFDQAISMSPQRSFFDVEGTAIEMLAWGERGKPGLLFLHGDSAHADWYSFICPFFAKDYRCAAISFSGMGSSGRRDAYSFAHWTQEALAAVEAAEFADSPRPILIAHSLGGSPAILAAGSGMFGGLITVDSALIPAHLTHKVDLPMPRPHHSMPLVSWAYDVAEDGSLHNRRDFQTFKPEDGYPDGMAVDVEGHIWMAFYESWKLRRFAPDGTLVEERQLPVRRGLRPAFGADDFSRLFLITGSQGYDAARFTQEPQAGALFEILDVAVPGLPTTPFAG